MPLSELGGTKMILQIGNRGLERNNDLPEVTQLVSSQAKIITQESKVL
jgi:hypothetical protein